MPEAICCRSCWRTGEKPNSDSAGEEGASAAGADGSGWFEELVREEARLVEFEVDEDVESSRISFTFQVCKVASGANDTRRLAE